MTLKQLILRIPFLGDKLYAFRQGLRRHAYAKKFKFERQDYSETEGQQEIQLRKIQNLLNYTKSSGSLYSANQFPAGYHTINLFGKQIKGQRNPLQRLAQVPFDFTGKSVLDIGSNQGGMLFAIADKISSGVGIDFDPRMINVSTRITAELELSHKLQFYNFNLENYPLDLIRDMLRQTNVDIVFLLSVCAWIKNWKELITFTREISTNLLFEANGSEEQMRAQISYLHQTFSTVSRIATQSDDDAIHKSRSLFLCQ